MKKVFSFAAIAALTMFAASCGNGEAEAKRIADSTAAANKADSIAQAEQAKHIADSTMMANKADSTAKAMEAKRIADSIAIADTKKPTGGSKPKPKTTTTPTPKVGGKRPGAN